jgi:dipeptidyl aminopeptidase/acylaminoacyl peptidase
MLARSAKSARDWFPVMLLIDRLDGTLRGERLSLPPSSYGDTHHEVISVAPDGRRLMLGRVEWVDGPALMFERVPITWPREARARQPLPLPESLAAIVPAGADGSRPSLAEASGLFSATEDGSLLVAMSTKVSVLTLDVGTGYLLDLRVIDPGTGILGWSWSPNAYSLAIGFAGLYDYNEADQESESRYRDGARLAEQIYRDATGDLAPADNPLLKKNTIEIFDLVTGARQVLQASADEGVLLFGADFSRDSATLMVETFHGAMIKGRRYPIYLPQFAERTSFRFYDLALRELGRLDAPELDGPWATIGRFVSPSEVVFTTINGSDQVLYYYHRVSGEFRQLTRQPGSHSSALPVESQRQIVFRFSSFTQPPAIYRLDLDGSALSRLTWINHDLEQALALRQDPVRFTLTNGQERRGTLIQPADAPFPPRDVPIIVWQEGGPGGPMANFWAASVERPFALLPSFGFALLAVPLAGREGYGPATLNALADGDNFGQVDIDEQAEIVRQMVELGWTSPGRVGITGCSYGGYFAFQSVARHPDLYAAANPQCSLVDALDEWNRGYASLMPYLEGRPPFAKHDDYVADSPIYQIDRIKAAVLSFHGTYDFLPETLVRNAHHQLVLRDAPARMISFVGAGHGISSASPVGRAYQLYAAQEQIHWFRDYLVGSAPLP